MFTPRVPGSGSSCHWEAVIISPQSIVLGIIDHATQLYSGLKFKAMKFISPQSTSMKSWFDCRVLLTHMALFSWFVYNKNLRGGSIQSETNSKFGPENQWLEGYL